MRFSGGSALYIELPFFRRAPAPLAKEWVDALRGDPAWAAEKTYLEVIRSCHPKATQATSKCIGLVERGKLRWNSGRRFQVATFPLQLFVFRVDIVQA